MVGDGLIEVAFKAHDLARKLWIGLDGRVALRTAGAVLSHLQLLALVDACPFWLYCGPALRHPAELLPAVDLGGRVWLGGRSCVDVLADMLCQFRVQIRLLLDADRRKDWGHCDGFL